LSLRQDAREVILESLDASMWILTTSDPHFSAWIGKKFFPVENHREDTSGR